jgi:hypothetical protein
MKILLQYNISSASHTLAIEHQQTPPTHTPTHDIRPTVPAVVPESNALLYVEEDPDTGAAGGGALRHAQSFKAPSILGAHGSANYDP